MSFPHQTSCSMTCVSQYFPEFSVKFPESKFNPVTSQRSRRLMSLANLSWNQLEPSPTSSWAKYPTGFLYSNWPLQGPGLSLLNELLILQDPLTLYSSGSLWKWPLKLLSCSLPWAEKVSASGRWMKVPVVVTNTSGWLFVNHLGRFCKLRKINLWPF